MFDRLHGNSWPDSFRRVMSFCVFVDLRLAKLSGSGLTVDEMRQVQILPTRRQSDGQTSKLASDKPAVNKTWSDFLDFLKKFYELQCMRSRHSPKTLEATAIVDASRVALLPPLIQIDHTNSIKLSFRYSSIRPPSIDGLGIKCIEFSSTPLTAIISFQAFLRDCQHQSRHL